LSAAILNIQLSPSEVARAVACINVPANNALLGVFPILAVLLGTDHVGTVLHTLSEIDPRSAEALVEKTRAAVDEESYPLAPTIWQFNDPNVDLKLLESALVPSATHEPNLARSELFEMLEMCHDSFPFSDISYVPLDASDVLEFDGDSAPETLQTEVRSSAQPKPRIGAEAVILPSIAVGSLYILSSKLKTLGED